MNTLTALSPLDGRYHSKTHPLHMIFSEFGLIKYRVIVEIHWLIALSNLHAIQEIPELDTAQLNYLMQLIDQFSTNDAAAIKDIEKTTNHDVKAVEYFLQDKFKSGPNLTTYIPFIHFGCTSADINNMAYALMLKTGNCDVLTPSLASLQAKLNDLAMSYADVPMLSRTHGQPATPTTVGKMFRVFEHRLSRQLNQLANYTVLAKFNGAVGNFNAHLAAYPDLDWCQISEDFILSLGLTPNHVTSQIEPHDTIAELMHQLVRINTILIDLARDVWGYIALDYFKQAKVEGEVGSSTMPHKVNPIDFENAEGNLGLANAIANHLAGKLPTSRWQRDLTDSTVMRNIGTVFGYNLIAYGSLEKGLNKLQLNESAIRQALSGHWELLAEPIQTILRRYGITDAYEQLKALTRGESITQQSISNFIEPLNIPAEAKDYLRSLTPEKYIGCAIEIAKKNH